MVRWAVVSGVLFALLLQQTSAVEIADIYKDCANATVKGCYGLPKDCEKQENKNCKMIVTYTRKDADTYSFQVQGEVTSPGYVAVGFSKDAAMISASVVACYHKKKTDTGYEVDLQTSINPGNEKTNKKDDNLNPFAGKGTVQDFPGAGVIYCEFTRKATSKVDLKNADGGANEVTFDLNAGKHFLLLARGLVDETTGQILKHAGPNNNAFGDSGELTLANFGWKAPDDDDGASSLQRPAVVTLFAVAMAVAARRFA